MSAKTDFELPSKIFVFDTETTGTDTGKDQVIELCVQFGLENDAPSRVWRFKPDVPISPGAEKVHGISMDDLKDAPSFRECAGEIRELFAQSEVLVGYNVTFDISMLAAEFKRLGEPFINFRDKKVVDAFRLWQQCEPRTLQHAHVRFVGGEFSEAHSAHADVAATGRVLMGMVDAFGLNGASWETISKVCEPDRQNWIGPSRHFQWTEDGEVVLSFGKHSGTAVEVLAKANEGYLRWMLQKDFPPHVHQICSQALAMDATGFSNWVKETYSD